MNAEYTEVKNILIKHNALGADIDTLADIGSPLYDDLFQYFAFESADMPYGVMKARTGMPDEWIADRLIDLGFDKLEEYDPNGLPLNFTDKYHDDQT